MACHTTQKHVGTFCVHTSRLPSIFHKILSMIFLYSLIGLKLLEMKTLTGSTAYDLAATSPMRDLINELGCDLLCDQSTPETYSSFHGVTAEEVNQFLALLVVLLKHFVPLHKTSCEMDSLDKTDGLRNLVGQLQQRHTGKSKLLLNVINRILS